MRLYMAPMEAITTYIYRECYDKSFRPMEKYFSPFIAPNQNRCFNTREENDVNPEHNRGIYLVPQILTSDAGVFVKTAQALQQIGYHEVNVNLGCPSSTVVSKGRGAGMLANPENLRFFLDEIYETCTCRVSVKTRIGMETPEEFERLLRVYNEFPIHELIVHPRVRREFYGGTPHREVFAEAFSKSRNPLVYNGDLFTPEDVEALMSELPELDAVMLGRGVLANPFLPERIFGKEEMKPERLLQFHDELLRQYSEILYGEKNVLFRMKELWAYMAPSFTNYEKYLKRIKKSQRLAEYREVVEQFIGEQWFSEENRWTFVKG